MQSEHILSTGENILDMSAHKYGNYHKYYEFHPTSARMDIIKKSKMITRIWTAQNKPASFFVLDIGCNEGDLSMEVLELARQELPSEVKCKVLGIDLDSSLADLANAKYKGNNEDAVEFKALDYMDVSEVNEFMNGYFKRNKIDGFSLISFFSITMWIHLNHGDDGMDKSLTRSVEMLNSIGGSVLIEPQPWKCYKNAEKRCKKLGLKKPLYLDSITKKDIDAEVASIMTSTKGINTQWDMGKEIWGRSLLVFSSFQDDLITEDENSVRKTETSKEDANNDENEKKREVKMQKKLEKTLEKQKRKDSAKAKQNGALKTNGNCDGDDHIAKKLKS